MVTRQPNTQVRQRGVDACQTKAQTTPAAQQEEQQARQRNSLPALDEPARSPLAEAKKTPASSSRRKFLGNIGRAGAAAYSLAAVGLGPLRGSAVAETQASSPVGSGRVRSALDLRIAAAQKDSHIPVPPHTTNGDQLRYPDRSASYSKGLLQDDIGVVNPAAWTSFTKALQSGHDSDFEAMIMGGTRTMNGPQGSYAFDLETADSDQFGNAPGVGDPAGPPLVPPFAQIASADYGTQLAEMYWASLLRDVAFTDYAQKLHRQCSRGRTYDHASLQRSKRRPRKCDAGSAVPRRLARRHHRPLHIAVHDYSHHLWRLSPLDQLMTTYLPGIDYMTDTTTFLQVQNGISTGLSNQVDSVQRYLHDGRGLVGLYSRGRVVSGILHGLSGDGWS